mgnify:CR=1 FL=1
MNNKSKHYREREREREMERTFCVPGTYINYLRNVYDCPMLHPMMQMKKLRPRVINL